MQKRGFTLIELLAVIIILSLLAIITLPIINTSISKSRKKAYKDTAIGVVRAVETYATNDEYKNLPYVFDVNDDNIKLSISSNESDVEYNGDLSSTGHVMINNNETSAIYIENNEYCAIKSFTDKEVKVYDKGSEECRNYSAGSSRWILDTADRTVERHESFDIPIPEAIDSEGEPMNVLWTITNQTTGQVIGENLTTVSGDYTDNLNDIIVINYSGHDTTTNQNYNNQFIVRVVDTKKPTINSFTVTSITNKYSSNYVIINYDATDIGTKQSNLKVKLIIDGVDSGWNNYGYGMGQGSLSGSLDGTNHSIILQVKDEADNTISSSKYYSIYRECSHNVTITSVNESNNYAGERACTNGILSEIIRRKDNSTDKICPVQRREIGETPYTDMCFCINDGYYYENSYKCLRIYYSSYAAKTCRIHDCGYKEIESGHIHVNDSSTTHSGDRCYSNEWSYMQSFMTESECKNHIPLHSNDQSLKICNNSGMYIGNECYTSSSSSSSSSLVCGDSTNVGEITCTSSSGGSSSGGLSDATVCGEAWACGSTGTEEPIGDLTVGAGTSGSEEPIRP